MTYFIEKISSCFVKKDVENPAFSFFFETKSREKKRAYTAALKRAQIDQENIIKASHSIKI